MKKVTIGIIGLLLIVSMISVQQMTLKLTEGKTYRYGVTMTTSIIQETMGQEMKIGLNSDIVFHLDVEKVNASGDITYIAAIDSSTQSLKSPVKDTVMVRRDIIGKRIRTTLSKEGKVLSKEILDSITLNPMGGSDIRLQVFREHEFDASKKAVIGAEWSSSSVDTMVQSGLKMATVSNYSNKVVGKGRCHGHDCYTIAFQGSIKLDGKGVMMGMNMTAEGNGKIKGTFCFDPVQGLVVDDDNDTDLEMTVSTTGPRQMVIPITQSMKSKRTLLTD